MLDPSVLLHLSWVPRRFLSFAIVAVIVVVVVVDLSLLLLCTCFLFCVVFRFMLGLRLHPAETRLTVYCWLQVTLRNSKLPRHVNDYTFYPIGVAIVRMLRFSKFFGPSPRKHRLTVYRGFKSELQRGRDV